jgi:hypothetical protein
LFRDSLEKKDVMEAGLSYDQIKCFFRQLHEIQIGHFISQRQVLFFRNFARRDY